MSQLEEGDKQVEYSQYNTIHVMIKSTKKEIAMSNIIPLPGYVLIKDVDKKIGSFEIASNDREREAMVGKVVGKTSIHEMSLKGFTLKDVLTYTNATSISVGQTIIYRKYHSESFEVNGEQYRMVAIEDVMGLLNEK